MDNSLTVQDKTIENQMVIENNSLGYIQDRIQDRIQDNLASLLEILNDTAYSTSELLTLLALKSRPSFVKNYLNKALQAELIEMTIPDKPTSRNQRYRLTRTGKQLLAKLKRDTQ